MTRISTKTAAEIVEVLKKIDKGISFKLELDAETYNKAKNLELELNAKIKFLKFPTITLRPEQNKILKKVFGKISETFAAKEMKLPDQIVYRIWEIYYHILC